VSSVYPLSTYALGIDVSQAQGANLDWPGIAASGVHFAIIKASEGQGYEDPQWQRNVKGAKAAGLLVGAYHYFWSKRAADVQAQNYLKVAGGFDLDLPPVIDFESLQGMTPGDAIHRAHEFTILTEQLWQRPVLVYTYPNFWRTTIQYPGLDPVAKQQGLNLAKRDLWIAHYGVSQPSVQWPFKDWKFWQFDGDGGRRLPQGTDSDFNWFRGTPEELKAYCASTKPAARTVVEPHWSAASNAPANPLGWADRAERERGGDGHG
jgi:lysozyme